MRNNLPKRLTSEESGAALLETAMVMFMIVPTITMSMYFFILTHRLNSAHFQLQNTLRRFSVGPDTNGGVRPTNAEFSGQFRTALFTGLDSVGVIYPRGNTLQAILLRNNTTCFYVTRDTFEIASDPTRGCTTNVANADPLIPNNFITVEVDVGIFSNTQYRVFNLTQFIPLPIPRVVTGMKMGNF